MCVWGIMERWPLGWLMAGEERVRSYRSVCTGCAFCCGACQRTRYPSLLELISCCSWSLCSPCIHVLILNQVDYLDGQSALHILIASEEWVTYPRIGDVVAMLLASRKVVAIQDASSSLSLDCGRRINLGYIVLACYIRWPARLPCHCLRPF